MRAIEAYERLVRSDSGGAAAATRVAALTVKGFIDDNCQLRASTLTFYTLLSIVPLLAVMFGIAKGFGLHRILQDSLTAQTEWQRELIAFLLRFSSAALENARGGLIAGIGVLVFFFSIVGLLGSIEEAFNAIWKVGQRSMARRFADYLSTVLVGTVLLAVSGGVSVFIAASGIMPGILRFVPFTADWLLFSFLFISVPNTRVPFVPGIAAGAASAALFEATQWAYVRFQIGVAHYGAVYGSFAALPLFLAWLQTVWVITLFGGELSRAIVDRRTYGFPPGLGSLSPSARKMIALAIADEITRAFLNGEKPPDGPGLCAKLRVPLRFFGPLIAPLCRAGVISEVCGGILPGYQPSLPPEELTVGRVLAVFEYSGESRIPDGSGRLDRAVRMAENGSRRLGVD